MRTFKLSMDTMDIELERHMKRTAIYAVILAGLLGMNKKEIDEIKNGAICHDIGKKLVDKNILNNISTLSQKEFEHIKKHTILGVTLLQGENEKIRNIALYHHEKWNGTGYPFKLKMEEIPLEARIVSIVDCYDALRSERVYKIGISHENALEILKEESGKSFDPRIISVFLLHESKFEKIIRTIF